MNTPGTASAIAVHFGQIDTGSTNMENEPVMVDQRVYIGHKWAGTDLVVELRNFLREEGIVVNDDVTTADLIEHLGNTLCDDALGTGLLVAPHSLPTEHLLLVLDVTNEVVWVEDRGGERIREYTLDQFLGMADEAARETVAE